MWGRGTKPKICEVKVKYLFTRNRTAAPFIPPSVCSKPTSLSSVIKYSYVNSAGKKVEVGRKLLEFPVQERPRI